MHTLPVWRKFGSLLAMYWLKIDREKSIFNKPENAFFRIYHCWLCQHTIFSLTRDDMRCHTPHFLAWFWKRKAECRKDKPATLGTENCKNQLWIMSFVVPWMFKDFLSIILRFYISGKLLFIRYWLFVEPAWVEMPQKIHDDTSWRRYPWILTRCKEKGKSWICEICQDLGIGHYLEREISLLFHKINWLSKPDLIFSHRHATSHLVVSVCPSVGL